MGLGIAMALKMNNSPAKVYVMLGAVPYTHLDVYKRQTYAIY